MKCEVCKSELETNDLRSNYSDHPHDGYWCGGCLTAYAMPRSKATEYLQARIHKTSQLTVRTTKYEGTE